MARIGKITFVESGDQVVAQVDVGLAGVWSGDMAATKKSALANLLRLVAGQLSYTQDQLNDVQRESAEYQSDIARLDAKLVEVQEALRVAVAQSGSWERAANQLQVRRDVEVGRRLRLERSPGALSTGDGAMDQLIRERDGLEGEVVRLENENRALRMMLDNPDDIVRLRDELARAQKAARRRAETITRMLEKRSQFHIRYRAARSML